MTTLTFTRNGSSWLGADWDGTELFSIHPSTSRNEQYLAVSSDLPGVPGVTRFNAADGGSKYDDSLRDEAIQWCEQALERWASHHLGVTIAVDSIVKES